MAINTQTTGGMSLTSHAADHAAMGVAGTASARSVLTVGGDHPYSQWWGSNGSDGLAAMFRDLRISPYLAICADESSDSTSGIGATVGRPGMITNEQALVMQAGGVEFISHGARHAHFWELWNTGIRVYYTGGEAAPTVTISTTGITLTTATSGPASVLWTTSATLSALRAAIQAVTGWACIISTELTGDEPSSTLMPLSAARSVTDPGGADATKSNQRFAICGGILLRYSGTAYRDVSISLNDGSNFLSVFADGARLAAISTAQTLTAIVAAVNALNVTGLTALVMDNGFAAQSVAGSTALNPGQKFRETYCFGDEVGTGLHRVTQMRSIVHRGAALAGGIGLGYALQRQVQAVKERAAAAGISIESFAQSGGRFYEPHLDGIADEHASWRGNRSFSDTQPSLSPHAMPISHHGKFAGHFTSIASWGSSTPYGEDDVKAVIDALGDSDGWYVNWLNHLCTPTPLDPSPYTGLNQHSAGLYTSSADQDEGAFWRELSYAAAARDAKRLDILPPTKAENIRLTRRPPSNLVFNPKFRNGRSNNLAGITTGIQGRGGIAMPGWDVNIASTDFSEASVSAGKLKLVTNGALAANKVPLGCDLFLDPGKTYSIGAMLNMLGWGSSNSVRWYLYAKHSSLGSDFPIGSGSFSSAPFYGGTSGVCSFLFTVPARKIQGAAMVRGIAGPFTFGGADSITVNFDNKGSSSAIALTGLTTAKAVAAAINAAIASDGTYAQYAQYHNCARAEDNRLIIEVQKLSASPFDAGSLLQVSNAGGAPLVTIFGAGVTAVRASGRAHADMDTALAGYRLAIVPSSTSGAQTMEINSPFCREVRE